MIVTVSVMGILNESGNNLKGLRLLVLSKNVDLQRRIQIASNLTFTHSDFDLVLSLCNKSELMFYDLYCNDISLLLNKWGLTGISVVHDGFCSDIKRKVYGTDKLGTFLDYLKLYNPNICFEPLKLSECGGALVYIDTAPSTMNYIHINCNAVCHFRPKAVRLRDLSDLKFNYIDGILVFNKHEDVFILTNTSARHIPVSLGEELTINLGNGYCMRTLSYIENNVYYNKVLCFDSLQRQWKVVSSSNPIEVYGRKKR